MIMPEMNCENACAVAEQIRRAVMDLRIVHGAEGAGDHVTLSVGVASHVPGECDDRPDRLLGAADQALYAAKRLGRNRITSTGQMLAEFARLDRGVREVPASAARRSGRG
jgi:diguanylate cyclase (GGDEF)-like protein